MQMLKSVWVPFPFSGFWYTGKKNGLPCLTQQCVTQDIAFRAVYIFTDADEGCEDFPSTYRNML